MTRYPLCRTVFAALAIVAGLIAVALQIASAQDTDELQALLRTATEGAAAGYLDDAACATCHRGLYDSFQDVGMSQALKTPANARPIENFSDTYFHEASNRYYRIDQDDDGDMTFVRYQQDASGQPINQIEIPIDWVLGSGNRARSYLYQTDHGELFMLPLSWYSEEDVWRMSPGFEYAGHQGVGRKITRTCMFCHNAFPEVESGSDAHWRAQTFPEDLPEGIGCQRCHGPGASHVATVLGGGSVDEIHSAIVNPAKLGAEERDSVCFQCHMLPSETIEGVRRVGRSDYSFRPGQRLSDYIVNIDAAEQGVSSEDRFEINHHAYRFSQSACYRESEGALACISCHNPHEKPESAAFRQTSSAVCQDCHSAIPSLHSSSEVASGDDCIGCHMPTRRTLDVVEVTMTDHRIATGPFDHEALVAPRSREFRPVTGIGLLDFGEAPDAETADFYRLAAALRANRFVSAARQGLEAHLAEYDYDDPTPALDLALGQVKDGDYPAAERTARALIAERDDIASSHAVLGTSLLGQGRSREAVAAFNRALALESDPETTFNLAAAYLGLGDVENAERYIDEALELRPYMSIAWRYRGLLLKSAGQTDAARSALTRTLEIDPMDTGAYYELITLLRDTGEANEAARYLEVGLSTARNPARLQNLR